MLVSKEADRPDTDAGHGIEFSVQQRSSAAVSDADLFGLRDEELMDALVAGHKAAFDVLVQRHKGRLYSYLLRLLSDRTEAEEVAQETLVRAYVYADKYRNTAKFSTWLYTIGTNLVRNRIRKWKRTPRMISISVGRGDDECDERESIELPDHADLPDRQLENSELHALVARGIERIPFQYREAFVLREVNGFTYEEIAAVTGLNMGTVRSRISRARGHFRDIMEPLRRRA